MPYTASGAPAGGASDGPARRISSSRATTRARIAASSGVKGSGIALPLPHADARPGAGILGFDQAPHGFAHGFGS